MRCTCGMGRGWACSQSHMAACGRLIDCHTASLRFQHLKASRARVRMDVCVCAASSSPNPRCRHDASGMAAHGCRLTPVSAFPTTRRGPSRLAPYVGTLNTIDRALHRCGLWGSSSIQPHRQPLFSHPSGWHRHLSSAYATRLFVPDADTVHGPPCRYEMKLHVGTRSRAGTRASVVWRLYELLRLPFLSQAGRIQSTHALVQPLPCGGGLVWDAPPGPREGMEIREPGGGSLVRLLSCLEQDSRRKHCAARMLTRTDLATPAAPGGDINGSCVRRREANG